MKLDSNQSIFRILYFIACILVAAIVYTSFLQGFTINERTTLGKMVYATAHKPFVCRTLVPTTVRITTACIPPEIQNNLITFTNQILEHYPGINKLNWFQQIENEIYYDESIVALIVLYVSLVGFTYALRYFIIGILSLPTWFSSIFSLIMTFGLIPFFSDGYLYDLPGLCLFTFALGLMVRNRWYLYLLVYFFACLNKETTLLLTLIFIPYYFNRTKMNRDLYTKLLGAQLGMFILVKGMLHLLFWHNQGSPVEFNWQVNAIRVELQFEREPIITITSLAIIGFLVFYRWQEKPVFFKMSLWIIIPLFWLYLFFGNYGEWRVFYEVYPIFVAGAAHTIAMLCRINPESTSDNLDYSTINVT